jgi:hypothetical protein
MGIFGGGENPAKSANKYFDKIPGELQNYFNPYIDAGRNAMPGLQNEYGKLMNNPGGKLNEIGGGYQQSPGFQFALQQALQGSGHAAAAGGMAGSPQHEQQNMGIATGLANQDYNQWLEHALDMYGQGIKGEQGFYDTGAKAGMGLGEDLASLYGQQGQYAYAGQAGENAANSSMWNSIFGGVGAGAGYAMGGPFGAWAGKNLMGGGS